MKENIGYFYKEDLSLNMGLNDIAQLNRRLLFADREFVENLSSCVQPIAAGIVMTKTGKILTVNKTKKSTGGVSPERDKTLLYVGGHISMEDEGQNTLETLIFGMKREINEELNIEIEDNQIKKPFLVYTPTSLKSSKHMGVLFPVVIEKECDLKFTDGKCMFIPFEKVREIENLEDWSSIVYKEIEKDKVKSNRTK